jgi:PAS domain S-box-containing protein
MPLEHPKILADAILRQNSIAFILVNQNGQVIFANEAASQLAWKSPEHTTIDPQSAPQVWGNAYDFEARAIPVEEWPIALALRGITTVGKELRIIHPDGSHYDISVSAAPLVTEDRIIGAIASFVDITKHSSAEQKLTAINARLEKVAAERARCLHLMRLIGRSAGNATSIREMFEFALTEICRYLDQPVGYAHIVEANGRPQVLSACYSSNPERYEALRRATSSIDFSLKESVIGEVLRNGTTIFMPDLDSEEHFLRKDAARQAGLKSCLAIPVMVHKSLAAVLEFFGIQTQESLLEVMDVIATHLGQVIEQKRTEKKLQALFDSAPDVQVVTDVLGTIVMANKQTTRLFGYSEEELLGKAVETLVPSDLRGQHVQHRARYIAAPHARPMGIGMELTALCKDGSGIPVEVSLSPVELDDGLLIASAIRDVREHKKLEDKLREKERLAEMGAIAAIFAHEVANPLTGISFNAQLIKDELPSECQSLINNLSTEIYRLESLLNQFRSFGRLGDLKFVPIDFTSLVERVVNMNATYWHHLGIHVATEFARNLTLDGDEERLHQVILNLTRNAIESMPDGGMLTLKTYSVGKDVMFEVSDTGAGIAEDIDIFELFRTTKAQGSGIGLYIVRQIVLAHHGTITYSTEQGRGTTFQVMLPKKRDPRA